MKKLTEEFYQRKNVVQIARELLGKQLFTNIDKKVAGGIIVETEAYSWKERGCHAFQNKKTVRNAVMFQKGGYAYVYLCYGMYNMVNVVTNSEEVAEAVLIRGLEPTAGVEIMQQRRGNATGRHLTSGPGKLTQALGITRNLNGKWLEGNELWIEEGTHHKASDIIKSRRIGIDYAGEDADLPWRFYLRNNIWVSKR
jgi:DNA-3-methyladenine glycosylase